MSSLTSLVFAQMLAAVGPAFPAFPPLPATFSQKLECAAPEGAGLERPFALRCAVSPGVPVASVVLRFRQGGAVDFTPAPTIRTDRGWYVAWLCSHDLVAGPLQYYFEARDATGQVVATNGDEESPSVLVVRGAPGAQHVGLGGGHGPKVAGRGDDSDPLASVRNADAARHAAELREQRRGSGFVLGMGAGIGHGWFPERTLDFKTTIASDPAFGRSGLPLLLPEVGWQFTDTMVSAQLRWQSLDPDGAGDPLEGSPAKRSWAVLLRAMHQFDAGLWQPFVGANLGFGDGFRVVVPARPEQGLLRDDTVRGGPVVLGPSGGALYHFNRHLALAGELRVLSGVPRVALVAELSLGAQVAF